MNIHPYSLPQIITSFELAALVGMRHKQMMRDILLLVCDMESWHCELKSIGGIPCLEIDKATAVALINRYEELEAKARLEALATKASELNYDYEDYMQDSCGVRPNPDLD